MTQALHVWMNAELVGIWTVDRGAHAFRYHQDWLDSPHARALSLSLPISGSLDVRGEIVRNYFDNLLPDNEAIRKRLGRRFQARADTFGLLQAIGRDCVGAVQLLPADAAPGDIERVDCVPLSDARIAELLQSVPADRMAAQDDELFRISIAGAQEKTALVRSNGQWCRPHGSTPTTHILKLPLGEISFAGARVDASDSVHNEWLCAQIIAALGLPVAVTTTEDFGDGPVLVVERFDRELRDGGRWIARLPQEDFCQALGLPSTKKYEQHGGPTMQKCLQLLQGSADKNDTLFFLLSQLAFFLLGAPDGHAKNFSIFLQPGNAYGMTPLYDVLSAWPWIGAGPKKINQRKAGLAMAVRGKNAHYQFNEIRTRHWYDLAMKNGGSLTWRSMVALVDSVDLALQEVETMLPPDFPARTWEAVSDGMRAQANRFLSEPTHLQA